MRTPDSIKGVMQGRIDRMNEIGQMLVKTAAILGFRFPRRMLNAMMPKKVTPGQIYACMEVICQEHIFACAAAFTNTSGTNLAQGLKSKFVCQCVMDKPIAERRINDCKWLCFRSATLQETAYEMYTEALRRKIHIKAARYMETNAHRCTACGGGEFLSPYSVQEESGPQGHGYKRHSLVSKEPVSKLRKTVLLADTRSTAPSGRRSSFHSDEERHSISERSQSISIDAAHLLTPEKKKSGKSLTSGLFGLNKSNDQLKLPQEVLDAEAQDDEDTTPIIDRVIRRRLTIEAQQGEHASLISDRRECTCARVLLEVYPQLVRHWKAAGNLEKTVHFLIESAAAAIALDENLQVRDVCADVLRASSDVVAVCRVGRT